MAALNIPHLTYIRQIPIIGKYIYEALQGVQEGVSTMAVQGNLDPNKDPAPPPNIQAVTATGQNGFLHVSIQDQSEGLTRGTEYVVEHADNKSFINAQQRFIGASRGFTEFIGNDTRFIRAYSTTDASGNSAHVYHGSASSPTPVSGGGTVGPPAYLPSQGAGTGSPGQAGLGQGPVQTRSRNNSFDWSLQSASGRSAGFQSTVAPVQGSVGSASGGSGGGSPVIVVPISATLIGSNALAALIPAPLPSGDVFVGSAGSLPVAKAISGDATLAASGALTLATVNTSSGVPGTFGDATHVPQVTINAKGLVTAVASVAITAGVAQTITSFMPAVMLGSTAVTSYAVQSGICIQTGKLVTILLSISIDTLGAGTGNVTIVLPSPVPTCQNTGTGCFGSLSSFLLLTGTPTAEIDATTLTVTLFQTGATGSAPLTNANLAGGSPGSTFTLSLNYESF